MPANRTVRALLAVGVLTVGLTAIPSQAHAVIPVRCSASALVKAIEMANAGGGERLALTPFCTYRLTETYESTQIGAVGLPVITTPITISGIANRIVRSSSAPEFRIFEVDGPGVVSGTNGQLNLTGVTVRNGVGEVPNPGGGIANLGGSLELVASKVADSTAIVGGGIYNSAGSVSLNTSKVSGNTADVWGGGIHNADNGVLSLYTSKVSGNSAGTDGGGIYNGSGLVSLNVSLVRQNVPNNCVNVSGCTS